jgi:hypothetical protein
MRGNPVLNFYRTAEAAGYPVLLIVSALCLGLVVVPVALLGLTDAGWLLGLAVVYLIVALAILTGVVAAALSDDDEPEAKNAGRDADALDERDPIVPLPRRRQATRNAGDNRRAA